MVLVIAKGDETNTGQRLRKDEWVNGQKSTDVEMGFALIRIWPL
jgi:hypothetical protein